MVGLDTPVLQQIQLQSLSLLLGSCGFAFGDCYVDGA